MAGDWIKMRGNLWDDPRVSKLCDITNQSEAAIVGALYWLWATADQHTEDGIMYGLTPRQIDRKTGVQGFAEALISIGWIADHPEGIRIINFTDHNGASAKKRCSTAKRVATFRSCNDDVTHEALQDERISVSDALAREEKRREVHKPTREPDGFAEFWSAYPKKVGKGAAETAWRKLRPPSGVCVSAVESAKRSAQWQKDGGQFIPNPATWLNQRRWEDGDSQQAAADPKELVTLPDGQTMTRGVLDFMKRVGA